jgi:hypothetical protein
VLGCPRPEVLRSVRGIPEGLLNRSDWFRAGNSVSIFPKPLKKNPRLTPENFRSLGIQVVLVLEIIGILGF